MADLELSELSTAAALSGSERLPGLQSGAAVAILVQQIIDKARSTMATATHTHTASSVTDFAEAVQDVVGAFIQAGTNITVTYDDAANTFTIAADSAAVIDDAATAADSTWSSTKINGLLNDKLEETSVKSLIGSSILAGANVTVSYDEATGLTTISSLGTGEGGGGTGDLRAANNLSELTNKATARTNLGLGTAATQSSSAFATAAQGTLASTALQPGDNLAALTDKAAARTALGLTETATTVLSTFATAAQGAKADSAVQPAALANVSDTANTALSLAQQAASYGEFNYGTFTGNGSDQTFYLYKSDGTTQVVPGVNGALMVWINDVRASPGTAYSVSGNSLIFVSAPGNGAAIKWLALGRETSVTTPADGSVTTAKLGDLAVTPAKLAKAQFLAPVSLPATTGTCTIDLSTGYNFFGTLSGNIVLANPTNIQAGQSGVITITNGSGPYTISYGTYFKPADGSTLPALTATAMAKDDLVYYCESSTRILVGRIGGAA